MRGSPCRSDEALVRAARLGDAEAFALIVDRHGPAMRRYARHLLGSAQEADDVTQEALFSAWRSLESYRGDSSLRTWLFTLVSRRAADLRRRRRPIPVSAEELESQLGATSDMTYREAELDDLIAALRTALHRLPWMQRACWLLREVEELSYDDIARALSTTPSSVRGQLYRARRELAEGMARWRR